MTIQIDGYYSLALHQVQQAYTVQLRSTETKISYMRVPLKQSKTGPNSYIPLPFISLV